MATDCRKYTVSAAKTASSATRSSVESRKAPALLELPWARATRPSTRSRLAPNRYTQPPSESRPDARSTDATPASAVLASVMALGETPSPTHARSTGPQSQTHHSMNHFQGVGAARESMYGV